MGREKKLVEGKRALTKVGTGHWEVWDGGHAFMITRGDDLKCTVAVQRQDPPYFKEMKGLS